MLSQLLRQILFTVVHLVISVLVAVHYVYQRIFNYKTNEAEDQVTKNDIKIILENVPKLDKKIKHLTVMAHSEHHSKADLARIVIWSLVAGIPYISFYDITGKLKKQEGDLFLAVEKFKKGVPGCIKWSDKPDLNGYSNGIQANTAVINIITYNDGKPKIAQSIRDIAENKLPCRRKSKEFSAQELNEALSNTYINMLEPDLVLYTGPLCCTYGLLPWQIRLTEFIQLSMHHSLNIFNYISALNKYYKCDQRFGK